MVGKLHDARKSLVDASHLSSLATGHIEGGANYEEASKAILFAVEEAEAAVRLLTIALYVCNLELKASYEIDREFAKWVGPVMDDYDKFNNENEGDDNHVPW